MPTIMTHAIIPAAIAVAVLRPCLSWPVIAVGMILAMLPDADVIGFKFGVQYGDAWGHRGASHSIFFAAIVAAVLVLIARPKYWIATFFFWFIAMASHGILDMFTDGGLGAAIAWPFSEIRFFAPYQPVAVSPIGISNFVSMRGVQVLISEFIWIVLPISLLAIAIRRFFYREAGALP